MHLSIENLGDLIYIFFVHYTQNITAKSCLSLQTFLYTFVNCPDKFRECDPGISTKKE